MVVLAVLLLGSESVAPRPCEIVAVLTIEVPLEAFTLAVIVRVSVSPTLSGPIVHAPVPFT